MQAAKHLLSSLCQCIAGSLLLLSVTAAGQSTYFNTPTSDVLGEKEFYVEAAFDSKIARFRDGGWQSFGIKGIYGVRKKTEIGLNAYFVRSASGVEPLELQPNIKYQLHDSEDSGTSLAIGATGYISAKRGFPGSSMVSVYAIGSKSFKRSWTPKVSGGAYQLIGASRDSGSSRALLLAVEQPIHERAILIFDWNTGKNRFGYAAAGVGITVTKRSYLYSAYYFGNQGRANNFLGIYYGVSF